MTAWSELSEDFQRDVAVIDALGFGLGTAQLMTLGYGTPLSGVLSQTTATDKFTQEFRLVSPESDSFEWLIGAYYTDEDSGLNPQQVIGVVPGTDDPAEGIPLLADVTVDSTYEEIAVFANATWHVTSKFDLSFGGRWSENDQELDQSLVAIHPLLGPDPLEQSFLDLKSSESPTTWSVSPRYRVLGYHLGVPACRDGLSSRRSQRAAPEFGLSRHIRLGRTDQLRARP